MASALQNRLRYMLGDSYIEDDATEVSSITSSQSTQPITEPDNSLETAAIYGEHNLDGFSFNANLFDSLVEEEPAPKRLRTETQNSPTQLLDEAITAAAGPRSYFSQFVAAGVYPGAGARPIRFVEVIDLTLDEDEEA